MPDFDYRGFFQRTQDMKRLQIAQLGKPAELIEIQATAVRGRGS